MIRKIHEISNETNSADYFICCASFEERSTAIAKNLYKNFQIKTSLIFKYDENDKTTLREDNFHELDRLLSSHSELTLPIICNQHDPLDGIRKLKNRLKTKTLEGANIVIDISTFTKQYLLLLLKYIEEMNPKKLNVYYAEPEDYSVKLDEPLSKGLVDITTVPTYSGRFYTEKEDMLILLLGYEGNRSYGIWEQLNPHKTILLIGKPSYNPNWEGRVEKFNEELIKKDPNSIVYAPTLDPFKVGTILNHIIDENNAKYNIIFSPLGPKPMTLGCYLALRHHPEVQVCYAVPKSHNEKYYSMKTGALWEFVVPSGEILKNQIKK